MWLYEGACLVRWEWWRKEGFRLRREGRLSSAAVCKRKKKKKKKAPIIPARATKRVSGTIWQLKVTMK